MPLSSWIFALPAVSGFLFFVFSGLRRLSAIGGFVKNARIAVSDDAQAGKTLHLKSQFGDIDLRAKPTHDPGLESIPKYPGAIALDPKSELEMEIHLAGRDGRYIEQACWTSDPFSVVLAYYQREFPNWKEDSAFSRGAPGAYRCHEQSPGRIRGVEIRHDAAAMRDARKFPGARTVIKYSVLYGDHLPALPSR